MADAGKPYTEVDNPAISPTLEDLGSGPLERAVFSRSPRTALIRTVVAIVLFIAVFGSVFAWLNH